MQKIRIVFVLMLAAGFFVLNQCTVLQNIQSPLMRVIRRGSCIAIDIPPITLTPARTAAENQLIGKQVSIEPDGWLIASAQSSALTSTQHANQKGFARLKRFYIETGTLDFYSRAIQLYKKSGLLGESFQGTLEALPVHKLTIKQKEDLMQERKIAIEIAEEVNLARMWLWNYKAKGKKNEQGIIAAEQNKYYQTVRPGEWEKGKSGQWTKSLNDLE